MPLIETAAELWYSDQEVICAALKNKCGILMFVGEDYGR